MEPIEKKLHAIKYSLMKHKSLVNNAGVDKFIISKSDCNSFIGKLEDLTLEIEKNRKLNLDQFIRANIVILKKIKDVLISEDSKKNYNKELRDLFSRLHNRIFIALKYNAYMIQTTALVTKRFTEFSKGITYFANEVQESSYPIYHRDISCGSSQQTSEHRFKQTKYGPMLHNQIQRCLIERLLYDDIYQKTIGFQDLGHSYELETVKRIYDKYFPKNSIKVSVNYLQDIPYMITIKYNVSHKERYIKTLNDSGYDMQIDCKQWKDGNYNVKTQTYNLEEKWRST